MTIIILVFTLPVLSAQPGRRGKSTLHALLPVVRATAQNTEPVSTVRLVKRVAREMLETRKSVRQGPNAQFGLSGESGPSAGSPAVRVRLSAAVNASMGSPVISDVREKTLRQKSALVQTGSVHRGAHGVIYRHVL